MRVISARAALFGTVAAAALHTTAATAAATQENPSTQPTTSSNAQTQETAATGSDQTITGHRIFRRAAEPFGRAQHH